MIDEKIVKLLEKDTFKKEDEETIFAYLAEHPSKELKDKIALRNIGLITKILKMHKSFMSGEEYEDLGQEGFIGLYTAIDRYDYKSGYRFSTLSYHYIYRYMYNYLNENKTIRLPRHFANIVSQIGVFKAEYIRKHGKDPTIDEIAKHTGISLEQAKIAIDPNNCLASLDYIISKEDDDTKLVDMISSDIDIENEVCSGEDMQMLLALIKSKLKENEYNVLMQRYGFTNNGTPKTLEEIGNELGVSRERIRQIENNALKKLRNLRCIKEYAPC